MQKKSDFIIRRGTLLAYTGDAPVVKVPKGVHMIGHAAFADNLTLEEVTLPDGLAFIEEGAFAGCTALRAVALPEGLRIVSDYAFEGCVSLQHIRLPASLGRLGEGVFWHCHSLKELALPRSVRTIPARLAQFCSCLETLTLPPALDSVGMYAFGDTAITSVALPEGLRSLDPGVFQSCEKLRKVALPDSIRHIGDSAFGMCQSLRELALPAGLETLGTFVFAGCDKLRRIDFRGSACTLRSDSLGYHVPPALAPQLGELWPRMTDGAIRQYVLDGEGWAALDLASRADLFLERHTKALLPAYRECIGDKAAEKLGAQILARAAAHSPAKARGGVAAYHALFNKAMPPALNARFLAAVGEPKKPKKTQPSPVPSEGENGERILKEQRAGALTKRFVSRDGFLYEEYLVQNDKADVALSFLVEKATPENEAAAAGWSLTGLTRSANSGLCALLRRSEAPDAPGEPLPDCELGGNCGICDTELSVEGGRLIYTITPCSPGCDGHARIDLGAATPYQTETAQDAVSRFEENWLIPHSWAVKHECIDNNFYEDWAPEDEED